MCTSTAQNEGLPWERSGQPGAQRGAGWAVESYSPELLQELLCSLGNVIPARQSPCGKGWKVFFQVLLSFEGSREFRVIYHLSLLEEICFSPPNLNLLLRVARDCRFLFYLYSFTENCCDLKHNSASKWWQAWLSMRGVVDKNRMGFGKDWPVFSPSPCVLYQGSQIQYNHKYKLGSNIC